MPKPELFLIELEGIPILRQLQLEEALLRTSVKNYCLINMGSPAAIVMGISGKEEEHLELERIRQDQITLIRRFSGGGTVFIDESTLFVTFLCQNQDLGLPPFPKAILEWSQAFYSPIFSPLTFRLKENDFVLEDPQKGIHKVGGNAEYLSRGRALLHTSFLWDYSESNMNYLKLPPIRPLYRANRDHKAFLQRLIDHFPCAKTLQKSLIKQLESFFYLKKLSLSEAEKALSISHRRQTIQIY